VTSSLTPRGSTRRWRSIVAAVTRQVHTDHAAGRPVTCPYCNQPIRPGQRFDVDHAIPRIHGGTDLHLRPAHTSCNRAAGATTRRPRTAAPSRPW
jgi:5-methylcytosine-specific restriction endonuclease McrA